MVRRGSPRIEPAEGRGPNGALRPVSQPWLRTKTFTYRAGEGTLRYLTRSIRSLSKTLGFEFPFPRFARDCVSLSRCAPRATGTYTGNQSWFSDPLRLFNSSRETRKNFSAPSNAEKFHLCWCPREELNLNLLLRREMSYPLYYEGRISKA